jgi:poly-beta-hydroxybutyrate-responsive repressor
MAPRPRSPRPDDHPTTPPASSTSPEDPTAEQQLGPVFSWTPRDLFVPYILLAVSLQRAHGYLIEDYLKSLGFISVEMSTLYRTLRQLEKDGYLLSVWEAGAAGPARRVYSLTDAGAAWLDRWVATLGVYQTMISRFFALYTGAQTPAQRPGDRAPLIEAPDDSDDPG